MWVARIAKEEVLCSLRAAGSSDPHVLLARTEEMLEESRRMAFLPTLAYLIGGAMTATLVGAVLGIPILLFGLAVGKTIRSNVAVADQALLIRLRLEAAV